MQALWSPGDGDKDFIAETVSDLLVSKSELLSTYFGIKITDASSSSASSASSSSGTLSAIPEIIEGFRPAPEALPMFLLRLATEVQWDDEKMCFSSIALELARLYSFIPHAFAEDGSLTLSKENSAFVLNDLMPALKHFLIPQVIFTDDDTVLQVADLESLYKVFERC